MATNNAINAPLPLAVTQGGLGTSTITQNGLLLGNTAGIINDTAAGITGQVIGGVTGTVPEYYTLTNGTNMNIVTDSGAETITFNSTGGGTNPAASASFFAYQSKNYTTQGTGQGNSWNLRFDTILFNNGGYFDGGSFAPPAGIYALGATVRYYGGQSGNYTPRSDITFTQFYYIINNNFTRDSFPLTTGFSTSIFGIVSLGGGHTLIGMTYTVYGDADGTNTYIEGSASKFITYFWGYRVA